MKAIEGLEEELTMMLRRSIERPEQEVYETLQIFSRFLKDPEVAKEYEEWQIENHHAIGFRDWLAAKLDGREG